MSNDAEEFDYVHKTLQGFDSQTELSAGRFDICIQTTEPFWLERFVMSTTMHEFFELLTVQVADDMIHHVLSTELESDGRRHVYLVQPVQVAAGATVRLHVLANSSGRRFKACAVGLPTTRLRADWN